MKKKVIKMSLAALIIGCTMNAAQGQWSLTGNSNATASSILGTTNAIPLNFTTNNINRLAIDANGKIGIATAPALSLLTMKGAGSMPAASWISNGAPLFTGFGETTPGNADFNLMMAATLANARGVMGMKRSRGTLAAPAAVVANDQLGSLLVSGFDGTNFQGAAAVDFFADGTPTAGNVPARISFVTGTNGSNRSERLRIGNTGDITINTNQLFVQKSTGNVGFGTISPTAKIEVNGQIKLTGGSPGAGKVLTSDANGLASWQVLSSGVGVNTTDYVPKWNGTSLVTSNIYSVGNFVGINTIASIGLGNFVVQSPNTVGYGGMYVNQNGAGTTQPFYGYGVNGLPACWTYFDQQTGTFRINNNGDQFTVTNSGNVGIGTNVPAAKLDVAGNVKIADGTQGAGKVLTSDANGLASWQMPAIGSGPWTTSGNNIYNGNSGNIGIGNSTPSQKLDVTGNAQISGNVIADAYQTNNGTAASFGLQLGGTSSGEVIGSKRTATGNQFGLDFYTASIKRLAINNNGFVGIGVDVPSAHLEVSSVFSTGTSAIIKNTGTGNVGLELRSTATPSTQFIDFMDGATSNSTPDFRNRIASTPVSLTFSSNAVTNAMTILNNGNVGIGTTTPSNKLSVTGDVNVDGSILARNAANTVAFGKIQHSGTGGNFHFDTYGTGGIFLNYFSGTGTYIGNGAAGIVASFLKNGNVGIGTTPSTYKLEVCGTIRANEVRVETGWCDYVFANDYKLRPLTDVELFIKENKHLPDVTPGADIENNGLEVGKVASQMIKKIEELTLYAIDQQKRIDGLQKQIEELKQTKR